MDHTAYQQTDFAAQPIRSLANLNTPSTPQSLSRMTQNDVMSSATAPEQQQEASALPLPPPHLETNPLFRSIAASTSVYPHLHPRPLQDAPVDIKNAIVPVQPQTRFQLNGHEPTKTLDTYGAHTPAVSRPESPFRLATPVDYDGLSWPSMLHKIP
ncbi:hypothetical protein TWF970_002620 [Orbilia oligospora]|uniref:Uncharacterized protein n=1 Tax=Orbilia oligospora TaxID=2813651 RepID=A0A7C8RI27_ORBOL|nr:hypothetical protein TWF970_002620 [Orbilia oligospora]